MSELNGNSAIEVFILYRKGKSGDELYEKLCNVIGKNRISEEEFKKIFEKVTSGGESKKEEIRQLVNNNQANLRLCILSDVIDEKSINQSFNDICEMVESIDYRDFEFWFDRFSSGYRDLNQKTFSDLPFEIIEKIVEKVDFVSQARLRKLSSGLRNIVDRVKPSINRIYIVHRCDETNTIEYSNRKLAYPYDYCRVSGVNNKKRALNDVEILLKNPRLRLESFKWINAASLAVDRKLIDILQSLNHQVEIVRLKARLINEEMMIDLLKAIKPGALKEMDFELSTNLYRFDRFAELDQWKQAKRVKIRNSTIEFSPNFRQFQHFESFQCHFLFISMDYILKMRNIFSNNVNFNYCYIKVIEILPMEEIKEQLGLSMVLDYEKTLILLSDNKMAENLENEDTDEKTLNDLAMDIIVEIVKYLDFKAQMRLRKVSSGLRNIMHQVKPSIDYLGYSSHGSSITLNYRTNNNFYFDQWYTKKNEESAFNDMKILLRNPKLRLRFFKWGNEPEIDQKLIDFLNSLNHQLEIKKLLMSLEKKSMIALLKAVKPGTLGNISFTGISVTIIDQLAGLDQWKQAKRVALVFSENVNFKHCSISVLCTPPIEEIREQLGLSDVLDIKFSGRYNIPDLKDYLQFEINELLKMARRFYRRRRNRKTFNDLPVETIVEIISYLNFKSQMAIRKVCRGLRDIVDDMKPSVDGLCYMYSIQKSNKIVRLMYHVTDERKNCQIFNAHCYKGENCKEEAFNDLKILLRNPRLRLESFGWDNDYLSEDDEKLIDFLGTLDRKLNIMSLKMNHLKKESMIAIMEAFDPEVLREIVIFNRNLEDSKEFAEFAEMEQWKQAKRIEIHSTLLEISEFQYFQHFESFYVFIEEISMDVMLMMRNVFSQNTKFKSCVFKSRHKPPLNEIKEQLGLSGDPIDESTFSGSYEIPDSKDYLLYEINWNEVYVRRRSSDN
uniref:F-box domain-containing protein n=1 Tax=Caenorhabditis tropicalis TaxID=1561998 RepID=A0A1I7UI99_9PELO